MSNILTKDQINDYRTNGFIYPVPVIPSIKADYYAKKLLSFQNQHPEHLSGIKARKLHLILTWMADLISEKVILDAVEDLLGPNIMCWSSTLFIKDAENPAFVSWHQDGNYWGLEPMDVITIWFAITSSTIKNGCVNVIPGTQKLGLLPHRSKTDTINLLNSEVDPSMVDEEKSISIELSAGDISVHHPFVLHGSLTNTSNQWRRGGSIQYMPVTTRIISKNWPCAFLLQGEDVDGTNEYQPIPKYIANQHMSFLGCKDF